MTHHHRHGGAFGLLTIVLAIAFAFGQRTARIIVGSTLIVALLCFVYVMFRIVGGTI